MGQKILDLIMVTPLRQIEVSGGDVFHAMRNQDPGYLGFGEAYFSFVESGAIKGWKRHRRMNLNLIVPIGMVEFVFHDPLLNQFRRELIGVDRYARITAPPMVWFGFQSTSGSKSLILNVADIPHDPNETDRMNLVDIEYEWKKL